MQKNHVLFLSVLLLSFLSCNLAQKSYEAEINTMRDTFFKAFPTVNRVSVEVKQDFGSEVNITFGDAELYNATEEERQKVTEETAEIIKNVFKPDDLPAKGKLIFVKEENTLVSDEASRKIYTITLKE